MIANPSVPAFRYDPYSKKFTRETYEHKEMRSIRGDAVRAARKSLNEHGAGSWAVVLGTLGRQGSLSVLKVCPCLCWPDCCIRSPVSIVHNFLFAVKLGHTSTSALVRAVARQSQPVPSRPDLHVCPDLLPTTVD